MKNIDVELSTPNRWLTALQFGARQMVLAGAFALCAVAAATVWAGGAMVNINTDTPEVLAEGLWVWDWQRPIVLSSTERLTDRLLRWMSCWRLRVLVLPLLSAIEKEWFSTERANLTRWGQS